MALTSERLDTVAEQYCEYLSIHPEVGFVDFSKNQAVLLASAESGSSKEFVLRRASTHVIVAPKVPVRYLEKFSLMAARVVNGFKLLKVPDELDYPYISAKDQDRTIILPQAHFFSLSAEEEVSDNVGIEMIHTSFYPDPSLAMRFVRHRELRGNRLIADPQTDEDWLEARLHGRYYRDYKNALYLNGDGHLASSVWLNGINGNGHKNGHIDSTVVLTRS